MRNPMPLVSVLLTLLALCVAPATRAELVTVAAYNVENFFDVYDDPNTADDNPKQAEHIERIAASVRAADADVIGFCEIEHTYVLEGFVDQYLADMGYDYHTVQPTNDTRGINLGIASRHPIKSITSYRFNTLRLPGDTREWQYARDLMHAVLDVDGTELHVIMVHFKSKRDSDGDEESSDWRRAEATFARGLIDGLLADDPDLKLVIMGDFNDELGTPPLDALLDGDALADAHADLPPDTITYLNEPYRSRIDFMLTTPALTATQTNARVFVPDGPAGSDHALVAATFDLP